MGPFPDGQSEAPESCLKPAGSASSPRASAPNLDAPQAPALPPAGSSVAASQTQRWEASPCPPARVQAGPGPAPAGTTNSRRCPASRHFYKLHQVQKIGSLHRQGQGSGAPGKVAGSQDRLSVLTTEHVPRAGPGVRRPGSTPLLDLSALCL